MEELVELYLFRNKKCPLPNIGMLHIIDTNAVAQYVEKKVQAGIPFIKLSDSTLPEDDFINFIAEKKNISRSAATDLLTKYCDQLQNLDAYSEAKLPHAGKFYVNADGSLVFKTIEVPKIFLPAVHAERIIHPDSSHSMTVGDKETTSAAMTAYYTESDEILKNRWWIWALVFTLAATAMIALYMNDKDHSKNFGNGQQVHPASAGSTYRVVE